MKEIHMILFAILFFIYNSKVACDDFINNGQKWPTVLMCILARNKAHTLPYSLSLLSNLDYPKHRISMWIRSDHNEDNTADVLRTWHTEAEKLYHNVNMTITDGVPTNFPDEVNLLHWSNNRFTHVMTLRNECLNHGRNIWAEYVFMLDADVFLTEKQTLKDLVLTNLDIVSPMLKSDSLYSNFWSGMTPSYYYRRTAEYKVTLFREEIGCFAVPMIHSAVLINLKISASDNLTYNPKNFPKYNGPYDDIIVFAVSANVSGLPLHVCNIKKYGYITAPLDTKDSMEMDDITNLKIESITDDSFIQADNIFEKYIITPISDKMGFDMVYMINLERRSDRREKMELCFHELGLEVTTMKAVDGRDLNVNALQEWGIKLLPGYEDPYHKRPMTFGEIGCFLSHYNVWMDVIEKQHEMVMVLEDDLRFEAHFRRKLELILEDIELHKIEWDLIYLGRKRLRDVDEYAVGKTLVKASYSYWTLGYLLSKSGAKKLLDAKPLQHMLPVDEYLPIMFDKHPNSSWSKYFTKRDLKGLSATPLIVYPTHYTGEPGYISDTEESHHLKHNEL